MRSQNLMAKLRRSKGIAGCRSKANEGCKRHPKHKQSPGVCSLCLGEKLSQLPYGSTSRRPTITTTCSSSSSSSSSLSSYHSSALASSSSSPIRGYHLVGEGKGSSFASRDKKKNGGFLSKLIHHHNNATMVH
ncbi:uncharacterized protein LOC120210915 [Hibiscus syriacus]|uniref:uncharacterized protein LOC120210915 n=1 Tax=Hibiscus syriacus TaxID=106335 RepID=UPI0019219028|nr:uncharacterized protein LOC120210915 [Hibiscus syriacus]